jgi:F0F1-type ATP synthase assembly protein I
MENNEKQKKSPNQYVRYSNLAFKMIAIILVGLWSGKKLDEKFKPKFPAFTVSLTIGALAASFYTLFKEITKK